ncbi:hypothetical protein Godav_024609 [Gossypium davidsonii]|uniref:Uncharacterized protein n=1 Tax=Gossypium davidsonii TaxID=34287 RepID=A0A7J8TIK3_GOSDV|nr:hypothetical protein [Gossypium davidsonii]
MQLGSGLAAVGELFVIRKEIGSLDIIASWANVQFLMRSSGHSRRS